MKTRLTMRARFEMSFFDGCLFHHVKVSRWETYT